MILTNENIFLIGIALVWIVGAILQDFKRREVDNLWNFSLIAIALSYRGFVAVFNYETWFFFNGVFGFLIFLALGNLFYYSRLFAGGDAKLFIALGAILPFSFNWVINLKIFAGFILLFLFAGSVYVFIYSLFMIAVNFKRFGHEFVKQWKIYGKLFFIACAFFIFWIVSVFVLSEIKFVLIGFIVLLFPILFVFAKAVEEACMIKPVEPDKITEGDWLYEDIYIGGRKIESKWEGVSKRELKLIKEKCKRKILIKYGVPFTPSFLFGLLILLYLSYGWGLF